MNESTISTSYCRETKYSHKIPLEVIIVGRHCRGSLALKKMEWKQKAVRDLCLGPAGAPARHLVRHCISLCEAGGHSH